MVFPREPLIKVVAPIMEAQLVETAILTIINHQSLIATKASRVVYAAKGDGIMEFGLRRAQGPDAGVYGARAAMIGGCIGTSNVLAGQLFDVPVKGTHAHSWIMSFPDEYTAFKAYASLYPDACCLLVDTYDTLKSGVPNAIRVFQEMRDAGISLKNYGIRLDSGDLAYMSKKARVLLDEAGFEDAYISASSDLDEYLIESLKLQGCRISSWGVGTNLITSRDCPHSEVFTSWQRSKTRRHRPLSPKLSFPKTQRKSQTPVTKPFSAFTTRHRKIKADLIALTDEQFDTDKDMIIFDPLATWKKTKIRGGSYTLRKLLVPVFQNGECVYTSPSVMDIRSYCQKELDTLWDETRRFVNPRRSMWISLISSTVSKRTCWRR